MPPRLGPADYFHHFLFIPTISFPGQYYKWGPLANFQAFFISGMPGGIDYFLLGLLKLGLISPLFEKRINSNLNVWLRVPGILLSTMLMYQARYSTLSTCHRPTPPRYLPAPFILPIRHAHPAPRMFVISPWSHRTCWRACARLCSTASTKYLCGPVYSRSCWPLVRSIPPNPRLRVGTTPRR